MPVYNAERLLPKALDCLLAQTHREFELLISDNASTDGTPDIGRSYAARDPRIRYVRHTENHGPAWNFAYVLEHSRHPYFMWAAHDDLWEPPFAAELLALLEKRGDAVLASCLYDLIDAQDSHLLLYRRILGLATEEDMGARLLRFVRAKENDGKAGLTYGIMRTDITRKVWARAAAQVAGWGGDDLFLFRMASQGPFVYSERLLFHKRLSTCGTLPHIGRIIVQNHQYYAAYERIVAEMKMPISFRIRFGISRWYRLLCFDYEYLHEAMVACRVRLLIALRDRYRGIRRGSGR
jgi:glycosyltransferase involved in cell wall biosynthesis